MRTFRHAIILILLLSCSRGAEASLKILEGEHTVVYDIVNPRGVAFIPDYSNESFEQKVISQDEFSKRVRVTSRMAPMKTRMPFPVPPRMLSASVSRYLAAERDRQSDHPSIVRLAGDITRGSRYAHEAANAVLSWVADNLTFDASITVPSDALSALRYKKAYCVGYSNLTVALLRAAGIPARVAHGYLPPGYEWGFSKEYWGVKVNDGGFHAYLEIYYPDTGWVFSDAEHAHNFVDPFHIILRLDGMDMPGAYKGGYLEVDKATFYTIFQEEDKTVMVDELPMPREKRLGRRLDETQHAALVNGTTFEILKFRTMVKDAEKMQAQLRPLNEVDGPVFKMENDPRSTTVGKLLRRYSIDEIPQLWNVLKGEMSLVGPRPPLPEEVARYEKWQRRRLSMKPGLTGLWQVSGRSDLPSFDQWMELDLAYIDNWSLTLDMKILLRTIPTVLSGRGAR